MLRTQDHEKSDDEKDQESRYRLEHEAAVARVKITDWLLAIPPALKAQTWQLEDLIAVAAAIPTAPVEPSKEDSES